MEPQSDFHWATPEISVRPLQPMLLHFANIHGRARLEKEWADRALPLSLAYIEDMSNFMSYAFLELALQALTEASADERFIEHAGRLTGTAQGLGFAYYLLRGLGTPLLAYKKTVEITETYNRIGRFEVEQASDTELTLKYTSKVKEISRLVCRSRMASFAAFPTIWDLPEAEVTELQCQVNGADCCRYHLTWQRRPIVEWRRWVGLGVALITCVKGGLGLPVTLISSGFGFFFGAWLDALSLARRRALELEENTRGLTQSLAEVQKQSNEVFKANVELDNRVAQRTRELEEALTQLRKIDSLKSEFFANVSHELRTPLTLILAPIEDRLGRELDDPQRTMLESVRRNAQRLLRLIDDLLDLSRIDAGHLRLNPASVELSSTVTQLTDLFAGAAKARQITLTAQVDGPTLDTWGDPHRIDSILSNLLGNAMKFTPAGGSITLSVQQTDTQVSVSCADTGPGIAPEHQARIFDRYYQVGDSDRRRGGVGIGLALARNLAEMHGGTLSVVSTPGRGSTFTLTLPKGNTHFDPAVVERRRVQRDVNVGRRITDQLTTPSPDIPAPITPVSRAVAPTPVAEGRLLRVLVVEDNDELREVLRELLAAEFEVNTASDGLKGLETARRWRPDLVLSDVMMPGLSGPGLCAELKADPQLQTIPVILLTARGGADPALEGFSSGADDFVEKPFHPRVLMARIKAQLRMRSLTQRLASQAHMSALGHLAAGIGHEIRNPLNAVLNGVRLLQTEPAEPQLLQVMADCATEIEGITNALLQHVSPAENGGSRPLDPTNGIESTLALLKHRLMGVTVHREYDAHSRVVAPAAELNQVFLNLFDNAIRANSRNIWVKVADTADRVSVKVRDDGPGISPEVADHLFNPFFTTREPGEGMGLGLYLSRQSVQRLGGKLQLASRPGEQTEFAVELPREV